jgi:hypothetical protein
LLSYSTPFWTEFVATSTASSSAGVEAADDAVAESVDLFEWAAKNIVVIATIPDDDGSADRLVEVAGRHYRGSAFVTRLRELSVDGDHGSNPSTGEAVVDQLAIFARAR